MRQFSNRMRWSEAASTAASSGRWLDWREIWLYRELIYAFVLREFQLRYRQTAIGVAWVVIQPLAQTLVFSSFFSLLGRQPVAVGTPYPLLFLTGIILWQSFSQGLQSATASLVNNRGLLTKTYFPRLILPMAAVAMPLIDFAINWLCLVTISVFWFRLTPSAWWLLTPLAGVLAALVALSISLWTSMLNSLYRDVAHVMPFVLQTGFFLSPVMFQTAVMLPDETWRAVAALNPLMTVIDLFRAGWLHQPLPTPLMMAASLASVLAFGISGLWFFHRFENVVADRV